MTDNKYSESIDVLLKEIYEWRETDEVDLVRSNNGGWHSPTDIFRKEQPGLKRICQLIINCFGRCTKEIAPEFKPENMDMKGEGWVNVNEAFNFTNIRNYTGRSRLIWNAYSLLMQG